MQQQNGGHAFGPLPVLLHRNAIAPQPPFLRLAVDGSLGGRDLPEKLP